jgi:hypothetical protein
MGLRSKQATSSESIELFPNQLASMTSFGKTIDLQPHQLSSMTSSLKPMDLETNQLNLNQSSSETIESIPTQLDTTSSSSKTMNLQPNQLNLSTKDLPPILSTSEVIELEVDLIYGVSQSEVIEDEVDLSAEVAQAEEDADKATVEETYELFPVNDMCSQTSYSQDPRNFISDAFQERVKQLHDDFYIPTESLVFYERVYYSKTRTFVPVMYSDAKNIQCACGSQSCKIKRIKCKSSCGFCHLPMRSSCIHYGEHGCCRKCFMDIYDKEKLTVNEIAAPESKYFTILNFNMYLLISLHILYQ